MSSIKRERTEERSGAPKKRAKNEDTSYACCSASVSLLDLPHGLIGEISTYLPLGWRPRRYGSDGRDRDRVRDRSLMGFISVVGRDIANKAIKRTYLKGRLSYLSTLYEYLFSAKPDKRRLEKVQYFLRQWMDFNEDWRDAAMPYQESKHLPLVQTDLKMTQCDELPDVGVSTSDRLLLPSEHAPHCVIVGIDGQDVTKLRHAEVKRLLLRDTSSPKELRLVHEYFHFFFHNPAVAIDLGMLDILQWNVESLGIDINSHQFDGLKYVFCPLLFHAIFQPEPAFFQYLMSREGLAYNPRMRPLSQTTQLSGPGTTTMLHQIWSALSLNRFRRPFGYRFRCDEFDLSRVEAVVSKEEIDVNMRDNNGRNCLQLMLSQNLYRDHDVEFMELLLTYGAQIDRQDVHILLNPFRVKRGKVYEVLRLLAEYT